MIKDAKEIIEYWYLTEFFNQEEFPKEPKENQININHILNKNKYQEEKMVNYFHIFHNLQLQKEIVNILEDDKNIYKEYPITSSNLHICVGKMKREIFTTKLYECLQLKDERVEKDSSEICLMGLQVDVDGMYIQNSYNVSPLIWGIYRCYQDKHINNSVIALKEYKQMIADINDKIDKDRTLSMADIEQLFFRTYDELIKPFGNIACERVMNGYLIYNRYNNQKTFDIKNDKQNEYSKLQKGFYEKDLKLVKDRLSGARDSFLKYIVGLAREDAGKAVIPKRIDIRSDKVALERTLRVLHSPLGKWPSKYEAGLMQQVAINLYETGEHKGSIFSVNGPPGTGKTTLLKEVVVSNIVNRAKFICEHYKYADDAFKENKFTGGENRGAYDNFTKHYYSFKDEAFADYGMLVCSCNNAAVENITKELPDGESLLDSINSDSENINIKEGFDAVRNCFDAAMSKDEETYITFNKEHKRQSNTIKDVYFTYLAKQLFDNDKAWGLISAPLGKNSNIKKYCSCVLTPLLSSFYSNEKIKNRNQNYQEAKIAFLKQLDVVNIIREKLIQYSEMSIKTAEYEKNYKEGIKKIQEEKNELLCTYANKNCNLKKLREKEKELLENVRLDKISFAGYSDIEKDFQNKKVELTRKIDVVCNTLIEKESKLNIVEKIFFKKLKSEKVRQIKEMRFERDRILLEKEKQVEGYKMIRENFCIAKESLEKSKTNLRAMYSQINSTAIHLKIINNTMADKDASIQKCNEHINGNRIKLKEEYDRLKAEGMVVVDEELLSKLDNVDIQVANPWSNDEYNREREKLFYAALKVHKEFVLSSKSCFKNYDIFQKMVRVKTIENKELCRFTNEDKKNAYMHLVNTIFLLTPVISTTFASVQSFLGDIEKQGALGQLIVDEAGQAAPHMAIGALWRCRKSLIVGDPKQVEPVITNDLDAIKKAFENPLITPYKEKSLSVQNFADRINAYGSYIEESIGGGLHPIWVGCPLIVHRRCVSPMFEISNTISYAESMKNRTPEPKDDIIKFFIQDKSAWIDVKGKEMGNKNHFVDEQGEKVVKMVEQSFSNYNKISDLYIISPFTTVIDGVRKKLSKSKAIEKYEGFDGWLNSNCGTVHKFQGKEAKEVIFLLGCDKSAMGAIKWVKNNIVNVAATRARFRLYVVGDFDIWSQSEIFKIMKEYLDKD
ncbi:AAA domain-containing protein [Clostridium estertheticum]|uniref:ATP-binding protein n=1 Tax=Clostridium estertheticum TaxID=238834 RepID=A0A7Y3STG0_9CLOT|nr:AAA domain-containing protein [Clostridium estertheticum]NNU75065.1 ATP-binding protein [Clostridium estertheticum]WBL48468.1 AAA domain-containing protein [Clostridium estertheticum]